MQIFNKNSANALIFFGCVICNFFIADLSHASYNDVDENNKYVEGISFLELIGAIDSGESFRPDDYVSRAEFFKILFKIFAEPKTASNKSNFTDVKDTDWFKPFADMAAENDLIEGDLFEPAKTIKRIDALNLLLKAYGESGGISPFNERTTLFKDINKFHPYYSIIKKAVDEEIISSNTEEKFRPFAEIKRGELADMMFKFDTWHTNKLIEEAKENSTFYKSDIFASIWNTINTDFYLPEGSQIDMDILFQAAVKGMIQSLGDKYTDYFEPTETTEFTDTLSGEFEGIGAVLTEDTNGGIFITEFINDSPAEDSGLKIGDKITAVDDISVEGMTTEEVINRIKGPKDTSVKITILRGEETISYKITRATIGIKLISGKIIEKEVWFIDIDMFAGNTGTALFDELSLLENDVKNPSAIVIDLRGNGGGYLTAGNAVSGMFVPQLTPLVHLDYGGGYIETIYNGDIGKYYQIPLYIFVDEYTASASEIVAQTLKEKDDAVIIGTRTFGKGTAQSLTEYWDGSALKLTIAKWLSADYTCIDGIGITPDITITTDEILEAEAIDELYFDALEKALD